MANDELKAVVRDKYGKAALKVTGGAGASCCDATARAADPITSNIYGCGETAELPAEALHASLGCGNPTALAQLNPGEIVLDLGSGGGIDVLLSARRVGATGKAYGLDMTDEMLALANQNKRKAGAENVEFLKGEIEPTRIYRVEDARELLSAAKIDVDSIAPEVDGKFLSAFVRAVKPRSQACCGPSCCN